MQPPRLVVIQDVVKRLWAPVKEILVLHQVGIIAKLQEARGHIPGSRDHYGQLAETGVRVARQSLLGHDKAAASYIDRKAVQGGDGLLQQGPLLFLTGEHAGVQGAQGRAVPLFLQGRLGRKRHAAGRRLHPGAASSSPLSPGLKTQQSHRADRPTGQRVAGQPGTALLSQALPPAPSPPHRPRSSLPCLHRGQRSGGLPGRRQRHLRQLRRLPATPHTQLHQHGGEQPRPAAAPRPHSLAPGHPSAGPRRSCRAPPPPLRAARPPLTCPPAAPLHRPRLGAGSRRPLAGSRCPLPCLQTSGQRQRASMAGHVLRGAGGAGRAGPGRARLTPSPPRGWAAAEPGPALPGPWGGRHACGWGWGGDAEVPAGAARLRQRPVPLPLRGQERGRSRAELRGSSQDSLDTTPSCPPPRWYT